jgi:plastocyanin
MNVMAQRHRVIGSGVAVVLVAALGASWVSRASSAREVVLVARGMAFYLEGGDTANPTIQVRAGDRVRVVLRNQAAGLRHDLSVPSLGAAMALVDPATNGMLEFDAPRHPGRLVYECRPHAQMMHGMIEVIAEP